MARTNKFAIVPVQEKLQTIANWILEKKGGDVLALDLTQNNTFTEGIIIVTANSIRHAQGLADHVLAESKAIPFEFLRMEGYQVGQWILLDMNDVIVSIFQEESRELYRLEDLWKSAPAVVDTRK
ncbi:MAG: Ribosomal silencing factor RsfS [Desulfovibrio sp.]